MNSVQFLKNPQKQTFVQSIEVVLVPRGSKYLIFEVSGSHPNWLLEPETSNIGYLDPLGTLVMGTPKSMTTPRGLAKSNGRRAKNSVTFSCRSIGCHHYHVCRFLLQSPTSKLQEFMVLVVEGKLVLSTAHGCGSVKSSTWRCTMLPLLGFLKIRHLGPS